MLLFHILMAVPRWEMIRKTPEQSWRILICHPNAGGVLVLGLGCENSHVAELKKYVRYDPRVKFLIAQEVEDEMEEAESIWKSWQSM